MEALRIEPLREDDWPAVAAIYREGIETRLATFETEVPEWRAWDEAHLPDHRLVARDGSEVVGWAALMPVSRRAVYAGVADLSVYVAAAARGQGVGRALLTALTESARAGGLWTLQAGVFPENEASLALHRSLGFRDVGVRERIGRLDGVWRDVVLLELRL
jgi:L-amino acid N-acyltransferase YncA